MASSSRDEISVDMEAMSAQPEEEGSSGEDEPIAMADRLTFSADPTVRFWMALDGAIGRRMARFAEIVSVSGGRLSWHLSPRGPHGHSIVDWAVCYINDTLAMGYVRQFYIGLTARLGPRWYGTFFPIGGRRPMRGHNVKWQRMVILGVSDRADEIGNAEKSIIAQFRKYDRRGYLINENGHPLCENRNPGGEGARAGYPPHLAYVCINWNPRT